MEKRPSCLTWSIALKGRLPPKKYTTALDVVLEVVVGCWRSGYPHN